MQSRHKAQIATIFEQAVASLLAGSELPIPEITLERPRDPSHGDLACTVAMLKHIGIIAGHLTVLFVAPRDSIG